MTTRSVPSGTFLPRNISTTIPCKKASHKPLKGCPDNAYYDITKDRDTFRIVLKSNGKIIFTTVNKTIAVATLEEMLS